MNRLIPFKIDNRGVRGFAVELDTGLQDLLGWRQYSEDVYQLLGQALAATPLLAADANSDTKFNLQFQGNAQLSLKLLVAQATPQADGAMHLRGMAKANDGAAGDFQALMRGGTLACLLEPLKGGQRYQAMVEIAGEKLSEALEIYFGQSEQLPTRIRLAASKEKFVGLMLQRMPEGGSDDDWVHVHYLLQTLGESEQLAISAELLLQRLFAEDTVRIFPERAITLACQCSHAQISAMLLNLGEDELKPVLEERGRVDVTCEYCGKNYAYPDVDVRALFAGAKADVAGQTLQ